MATVKSKTSIKIDELVEGSVVSGSVDTNGHLALTTRGGAVIDAGFVAKPFGGAWVSTLQYDVGDVVGYAGMLWKAKTANINKVPALFTSIWTSLTGESSNDWVERDPTFLGDDLHDANDFSVKIGTGIVVGYTSTPGEFESGIQALKINAPSNTGQWFSSREENLVRNSELITVQVRAKILSAAAGASLDVHMIQNGASGLPKLEQAGVVDTPSAEGLQALTTSWATYTWRITAANAKPRAVVQVRAIAQFPNAAVFCIDEVRVTRGNSVTSIVGNDTATVRRVAPAQSIDNATQTTIVWNTIVDDSNGLVPAVANGIKVKTAGTYLVTGHVTIDHQTPVAGAFIQLYILVNGAVTKISPRGPLTPSVSGANISDTIKLAAGDTVSLAIYQSAGTTGAACVTYHGLVSYSPKLSVTATQGAPGPQGIQGPPGSGSGSMILSGPVPPTSADGIEGNFYVDKTSNVLYGPKTGTNWPVAMTGGASQGAEFTFDTPMLQWVINHNFNSTRLEVNCYDLTGTKEYDPEIDFTSANQVTVTWYYATAGIARILRG